MASSRERVVVAALLQVLPTLCEELCEMNDDVVTMDCLSTGSGLTTSVMAGVAAVGNVKLESAAINGFVEVTVPAYNADDFRAHFRMTRHIFQQLCPLFAEMCTNGKQNISGYNFIGHQPETKLLLIVWTLANQETFRQVGDRFGVSRGYAHYLFKQGCDVLCKLASKHNVIKWPSDSEVERLVHCYPFPGGFGAVDGSHIQIKTPCENAESYLNRKSFASIVLQAVCRYDLQFIDVSTGWPGSMHDARIYRKSKLHQVLTGNLRKDFHILGDSAYPLEECLLVPYRDNGHLTREQRNFNYQLSASRQTIERAFALLKGKFRRLKYLDMSDVTAIPSVILAACTLHNFILQGYGDADDVYTAECDDEHLETADDTLEQQCRQSDKKAVKKRNELAAKL